MTDAAFLIKKIVTSLVLPVGLCLVLLYLGLLLPAWRRGRRWGPVALWLAVVVLTVCSFPVVGSWLLLPLEKEAGGFADPARLAGQGVSVVVVLGGSMSSSRAPWADRLSAASLVRLHEGVRLWKALPHARLILSDGTVYHGISCAEVMARLAREMGVPASAIEIEPKSLDTEDQADRLAPRLRGETFVLVTSAFHAARARGLFQRRGLHPVMAPVNFRALGHSRTYYDYLPSSQGLELVELALKEYLGRLWYWVKSFFTGPGPVAGRRDKPGTVGK